MTDDATLPATKGDLAKVQQDLVDLESRMEGRMASKQDLMDLGTTLRLEMKDLKGDILSEIKHYFDLTVETIRHDLLGANKDDIEVMRDRITRLEHHTGLVAS